MIPTVAHEKLRNQTAYSNSFRRVKGTDSPVLLGIVSEAYMCL
jgi:hypothetical protein